MSAGITRAEIARIEPLIRPYVRRTPVIAIDAADFNVQAAGLALKLELLQHAGSFKPRGAFTNLLTRDVPNAGVAAASGGNHGAAVAFAAGRLDIPAKIFVPEVASPAKIAQIRNYGADLTITGQRYGDALAASKAWVASTGALEIHAFNQPETLLGQGTVGLEFEQQAADCDTILVSVGGGGLIGGIAAWYAGRSKVVAVEPEGAPTLHDALRAGEPVDAPTEGIAADSLAPKQVGQLMFPLAQKFVSDVVLVSDDDIRSAQDALWTTLRIVAEPGGAAALSALLSGRYRPAANEKVGVLICGGNTTAVDFARQGGQTSTFEPS